jgi:4-amino-4-deoxy-L-arabinose transferase-like glycosyltransferase
MFRRPIVILIALYLLLGLIYAASTPIFEASDEIWHYAVVRELVTHHKLPVQTPGQKTTWVQEGSQPPLYYLTGALLTAGVDISDYEENRILNPFPKIGRPGAADNVNLVAHPPGQSPLQGGTTLAVYLIRWLSLLMGAGTIYFSWRLARTLAPGRDALALLAAALAAFNPMVIFINASVNNDNLLMLLSTLALWLIARELTDAEPDHRWRDTLFLGVIIALAMLTKLSGAILLPVAALAYTFSAWKRRAWGEWAARGMMLGAVVLLIAGWWYARNWMLYDELFGTKRMALIAGMRPPGFNLAALMKERSSFWFSYWGVFGAFNVLAPAWFFRLVGVLTLAAGLGLLVRLGRSLAAKKTTTWPIHLTLVSYLALSMIGVIRWSLLTPASQGRLLFGGVAVIAFYLATGLQVWMPARWRSRASASLAAIFFLSAAIIPFTAIRPHYRPPEAIPALPADVRPLNARFGDHIELLGYRLDHEVTEAGQPLDITLYWRADAPMTPNYDLSLNGFGYQGENVIKLDTWPGGGLLPTSFWQANEIYPDHYLLPADPMAQTPTILRLAASFSEDLLHDGPPLPAFSDGQPVQSIFMDAGDLVSAPGRMKTPETPAIASWDGGIQLHGYQVDVSPDRSALTLTLDWSATQPIPVDYTTFVHLRDQADETLAQGDAPPREGFWPTSHWRTHELVRSTHVIPLPPDLPPGAYRLLVGLYDPANGQRPPAFDAQGAELPERAFVIDVKIE